MNPSDRFSFRPVRCLVLVTAFLSMLQFASAALAPGERLPELPKMQDQHEVAYAMPAELSHVAVAFTMSMGKAANGYFSEKGATYLPAEHAIFIANIYGMPAIGRFFAMPKMKKYPHRIMLADAEGLLDAFPEAEDKITIVDLNKQGVITHVRYWDPKSGQKPF